MTINGDITELHIALDHLPFDEMERATQMIRDADTVYLIGNGGSAATAEHFACDLMRHGKKAICLSDNMSVMTMRANDSGYRNIFAWQLVILMKSCDLLVAISTSGNSKNIINAVKCSLERNWTIIGMTGKEGGKLAKLVDLNLSVPLDETALAEDVHLIMAHMIVKGL